LVLDLFEALLLNETLDKIPKRGLLPGPEGLAAIHSKENRLHSPLNVPFGRELSGAENQVLLGSRLRRIVVRELPYWRSRFALALAEISVDVFLPSHLQVDFSLPLKLHGWLPVIVPARLAIRSVCSHET
jgi:hypothetical protein